MPIAPITHREEYLKKKRKRKIIKYSLIGLSIVVIIGLVSYISHRPSIRISKVTLTGGILVKEEDVAEETFSFVRGSYFWLFPKNNVLWYPHKKLSEYLMEKFKRIDTINMHLENFHTLAIDITERKPTGIWCDTPPSDNNTMEDGSIIEHCYFLDQDGTIFAPSPYFSGDAYFKYYGFVTVENPIGSFYISSSTQFVQISDFISNVQKLSLRPQYLLAKGMDEFSLVIYGGGEIYFDTKKALSQAESNLEALLKTPELSSSISNLDYIDLRYGNKLFYKLKQ